MVTNTTNKKEHFVWLDALRFIAAFLVLLCHTRNDFFVRYNFLNADQQDPITFLFYLIGRLGSEAVFTFFILSGFLVGGPGLERIMNSTFRLKSYIIDRFVRIMIPLSTAILFFLIIASIISIDINWGRVFGNLLSLQGIICDPLVTPFWSLSYEVWFYIVLASFALIMRNNYLGYLLFSICCITYVRMNPLYLLMWLIGAAAYLTRPKELNKCHLTGSIIMLIIAIALTEITKTSKAIPIDFPHLGEGYNLFLCITMGWFVQQVILLEPKRKWSKKVELYFSKLAKFSYTLYLTHRIVLLIIFTLWIEKEKADMSFPNIIIFIGILLICLLISYFIYLLTEKHTQKIKCYLKEKLHIYKSN